MNIVFLDCTQNLGFQFSAANTKVQMLASGLARQNDTVSVINGPYGSDKVSNVTVKEMPNISKVVTYPYCKGGSILPLKNLPMLKKDLKNLFNPNTKNILVLEAPYIHLYIHYANIGHRLGYKIAVISHEWATTIKGNFIKGLLFSIYAKTFGFKADGILPISEYIIKKIHHFKKPYLKTPVLAEFNEQCVISTKEDYFLYCVYTGYFRVIKFMLDAFKKYCDNRPDHFKMMLVLTGTESQILMVTDYIKSLNIDSSVIIKSKIPYQELIDNYAKARALIIPLDPGYEQDEARFSQKIAEYLSSGSPILTNNVGEIKYYFTDKKNVILSEYSINGFASAFSWIQDHTEECNLIGQNGFKLGKGQFNAIKFGRKLHDFLYSL